MHIIYIYIYVLSSPPFIPAPVYADTLIWTARWARCTSPYTCLLAISRAVLALLSSAQPLFAAVNCNNRRASRPRLIFSRKARCGLSGGGSERRSWETRSGDRKTPRGRHRVLAVSCPFFSRSRSNDLRLSRSLEHPALRRSCTTIELSQIWTDAAGEFVVCRETFASENMWIINITYSIMYVKNPSWSLI